MNNEVLGERAQNAEGAATEEQSRLKQYKNLAKHEDMRRRRTECSVELRKQKRDDLLMKRRNLVEEDEEDELNVSEDGSKQQPEGGNKKPPAPVLTCDQVVEILKNNPDVQQTRDAFESVRRLLSKSKNPPVDEVINCGLIHALVQGLSIPDEKIPYECAWALTNIVSGTSEQTVKAVESGATGPLIQLMMHADLNLAEQATWAVANIAGDSAQLRDFVIQSSGVEALMVLCSKMGQLTTSFVRTLAWTFSNMCRHKNPHAPLPVLQVLAQGLLRLMQHEDYNVRQDACWAVSYLTDGPDEQITLARDAGIMPFVYKHLSEDDGLVAPALRVLGNMATGNDVLTQTVIELGTLRVLPAVARKAKSSSIVKECCWLISNVIAGTQQQIQAVIDAGLLTMLVTIMQTGDYRCQFECSWALANLAQGGTTRQILELTGEKPMAALAVALGHTNADLLSNILEVIYSLLTAVATNKPDKLDALKEEVEEAGVLDKLEALQENHNEKGMDHAGKGHGGMKVDHGSNHGGGGMEMNHGMSHGGGASSGPMMWDWFHTAINETVLFPWWRVTNLRSLLLSCALVAAAGFTLEWLRTVRARLKAGAGSRLIAARHGSLHGGDTMGYATFSAAASKESGLFAGLCSPSHVRDTLLFGVQTALSYTIMMVFMTYSVQLCTALVAGTALGYYVHGRRRRPL